MDGEFAELMGSLLYRKKSPVVGCIKPEIFSLNDYPNCLKMVEELYRVTHTGPTSVVRGGVNSSYSWQEDRIPSNMAVLASFSQLARLVAARASGRGTG